MQHNITLSRLILHLSWLFIDSHNLSSIYFALRTTRQQWSSQIAIRVLTHQLMDIMGFDIWVKYKILADALEGHKIGPQNMQKVSQ